MLPTAGVESEHQIRRYYEMFGDRLCDATHISLIRLGGTPFPSKSTYCHSTLSTSDAARW